MNDSELGLLASIFASQLVNHSDVEPELQASSGLTDLLKIQPTQGVIHEGYFWMKRRQQYKGHRLPHEMIDLQQNPIMKAADTLPVYNRPLRGNN